MEWPDVVAPVATQWVACESVVVAETEDPSWPAPTGTFFVNDAYTVLTQGTTMTSRRTESPSRHLTAVSSRVADARALKAAQGSSTLNAAQGVAEPQSHVPAFLLASQPNLADQKAREELIAEAAYLRAASRGFEPGHELEDWLAAEKMVDASMTRELPPKK
jgi:hypothetical protein